jgi:tripartite-type tricarboxylate transporter receptor subunit TctC
MSPPTRRACLQGLAALPFAAPALWADTAHAQTAWPSRPIRILVGYSPGGAVDIIARAVGEQLQAALGQAVIVENKPGAGTNIANRALIDASPDGHTLMLAANALAANVSLFQPAPYQLERDITPIGQVGRVPVVLAANAQAGIASVKDLVAQLKARPASLSYGSPGNGATPHLAMELFAHAAGVDFLHVPYKGGALAMNDVIAGHIPTVAVNALEVQPHVKAGRLKVLAVLSAQRTAIFPDAPTIAESGWPGFEASVWYGLVGPRGLPAPVVQRLHAELQKALAVPAVRDRLSGAGGEVTPGSTAQFAALLSSERQRYEQLIRRAGIKPD